MRVAVVGAGASGLFVSGLLAQSGIDVVCYEKNEKQGKKLFITGKGRCNFTNKCSVEDFLKNVVHGDKFLKSALYNFSSDDAFSYFENLGLACKVERGNRAFPESDKSSDVIKILRDVHCKGVEFRLCDEVLSITKDDKFHVVSASKTDEFDKVVIATGGVSYRSTGASDSGYKFAKAFGHKIIPAKASLCPIVIKNWFVSKLQGVSLKNVQLNVVADGKKFSEFGEMLFTDKGVSGPIALTTSCLINRAENVALSLDFKPALSEKQLDLRLLRDFEANKNRDLKTVLKGLLPFSVAGIFAKVIGLDENKKIHDITKQERSLLLQGLKDFKLIYGGLYDIDTGIVTSGGVCTDEINPKTMESKICPGLFFLGEVLDVDAFTGGFNLQIAWSTAFACAKCLRGW